MLTQRLLRNVDSGKLCTQRLSMDLSSEHSHLDTPDKFRQFSGLNITPSSSAFNVMYTEQKSVSRPSSYIIQIYIQVNAHP